MRAMRYNAKWLVKRSERYENSRVRLKGRKLNRWIERYRHRPLNMLSECYGKACPNFRLKYPQRRKQFVECVISRMEELRKNSLERLQVVFLGSGSLLQEIILLTRLCEKIDIKQIVIVCCDEEYVTNDSDEKNIMHARFSQAISWMTYVASHVHWSWMMIDSWEQMIFGGGYCTIICVSDLEITPEWWEKLQKIKNNTVVVVVLDNHGTIHMLKYDRNSCSRDESQSMVY